MYSYIGADVCWSHQYQAFVYTIGFKSTNNIKHEQFPYKDPKKTRREK